MVRLWTQESIKFNYIEIFNIYSYIEEPHSCKAFVLEKTMKLFQMIKVKTARMSKAIAK